MPIFRGKIMPNAIKCDKCGKYMANCHILIQKSMKGKPVYCKTCCHKFKRKNNLINQREES